MTESEVWWGIWVEMVVHPALGCSTWNITWHCSVKQNLKSQIRSDLKSQIGLCRSGSNSNSNKHPYLLRNVWQSERVLAIHNTKNRIDTPNVFAHQAEPSRFCQSLCMTLRSSRWPTLKSLSKTESLFYSQFGNLKSAKSTPGSQLIHIQTEAAKRTPNLT